MALRRMEGKNYEWEDYTDRPFAFLRKHQPRMEDANYMAEHWPKVFATPDYFNHADPNYGGSLLGQANFDYWEETYTDEKNKNWWQLGEYGILVRLDLLTKSQQDDLDNLESYPLLDEERHSLLEGKAQTEAWDDWGRDDYKRNLVKLVDDEEQESTEEFLDNIADKDFDDDIYDLWRSAEQYPEGGDDVNFPDVERLLARPSWQREGDPKHIEPWLGTLDDLLRFFPTAAAKLHAHYTLSDAAFEKTGKSERTLRIKSKDLPSGLTSAQKESLIRADGFSGPYNAEICESLYIDCEWDFSSLAIKQASEAKKPTRRARSKRRSR